MMTGEFDNYVLDNAYKLGKEAAQSAASWAEAPTPRQAGEVLKMIEDGDPVVESYLPSRPSLTAPELDQLTGELLTTDPEELGWDDEEEASYEIGEAWDKGVTDTFEMACAEELRKLVE